MWGLSFHTRETGEWQRGTRVPKILGMGLKAQSDGFSRRLGQGYGRKQEGTSKLRTKMVGVEWSFPIIYWTLST